MNQETCEIPPAVAASTADPETQPLQNPSMTDRAAPPRQQRLKVSLKTRASSFAFQETHAININLR
jgi:hypothetical protein